MSIESVMPSNHLILCHPLLLLPSIFPSIRVFSNESVLRIRWPKYWSFSISPSNEYSGLISFRIDWLDLLAVQGTLKSFPTPQLKSINSSTFSLLFGPTLCRYIMQNTRLDESQAGIKIAGRNINNLRYADDTILMAKSKEELKNLFLRVKEESDSFKLA